MLQSNLVIVQFLPRAVNFLSPLGHTLEKSRTENDISYMKNTFIIEKYYRLAGFGPWT